MTPPRLKQLLEALVAQGEPVPSLSGFEAAVLHWSDDAAVDSLNLEDLAFATACLEGDRRALARLRTRWLPKAVARVDEHLRDEVSAELLTRLLAPPKPTLATYAARGSLAGWLTLSARRLAIDLSRRQPIEAPGLDELPERMSRAFSATPEWSLLKAQGRKALGLALEKALDGLSNDERRLLRWHFIDGVPHGALGERLKLPRSTVAHRLQRLRERLFEAIANDLSARLSLDERSVRSLVDGARSGWLPSLRGLGSSDSQG